MIKLAICTPCYGDPKAKFLHSLTKALCNFSNCEMRDADGNAIEKQVEFFLVSSSVLTESRHRLVAEALNWGATHLLWLDADHIFPEDAIQRLLQHNKDVVGCNYPRRMIPTAPTAAKTISGDDHRSLIYTTFAKAAKGEVETVDHVGFGVCLMQTHLFDAMQEKAEADGQKTMMPLFEFSAKEGGSGLIGEDAFFFKKVRDAGGSVYVDHGLSWEVGHIHEQVLTNAHACKQEDAWLKFTEAQNQKSQIEVEEAVQ